MAKSKNLSLKEILFIILLLAVIGNPITSLIFISVGIFLYFFIKVNYERIKIEEKERLDKERFIAGFRENMSGEEYEEYCKYILKQKGWRVNLTPTSGDQGVDLIASKEYLKVCIQCKRYSKPVGNKAVQEIFAGKQYYDGSHGVLVSNAGFTKSAKSLALKTEIILLSDINLKNLEAYCVPV